MSTDFTTCRAPGCESAGSPDRPFCPTHHWQLPESIRCRLGVVLQAWRRSKARKWSRVDVVVREAAAELSRRAA